NVRPLNKTKGCLIANFATVPIVRVLKETNGVVAGPKGAAQRLGLKRTTLLSRMKRLGIDKSALI
ncbi:hypothetical protein M3I58_07030, partial [Escherichia coli]|nr:hypothetical protein [Escherichia coli]